MKKILWFEELSKKDIPKVGGKGANLGEMLKADIPVPPGFCVAVEAYRDFLDDNSLWDLLKKELTDLDVEDTKRLNQASNTIKKAIEKGKIDPGTEKKIKKAYQKLGRPYVAVRSSATAEDLPSIDENEHVLVEIGDQTVYDKIKNIYKKWNQKESLRVPSLDKNNKVNWKPVDEIYRHRAKGRNLYKITTETGREITISPRHSLITLDPDTLSPKVVNLDQLKGGERIPCLKKLPPPKSAPPYLNVWKYVKSRDAVLEKDGIKITNRSSNWKLQRPLSRKLRITSDLCYFLGIYAAEGSTYKNNGILVTNRSPQVQKRVKGFLRKINLYHGQKINKHSIRVYCKTLVRLLHELSGKPLKIVGKGRSCRIKKVPNFIFGLNERLIGEFLKGVFDGDGYIQKGSIALSTTSELLAGGVIKLLEILGLKIYLGRKIKRSALIISIPLSQAKIFRKKIGFSDPRKKVKLETAIQKYDSLKIHPDFKSAVEISGKIGRQIRKELLDRLPKDHKELFYCPKCKRRITARSAYKGRRRFNCKKCHKTFYEEKMIKKRVLGYINYDQKGQFVRGASPWNKGLYRRRLSEMEFEKLIKRYNLKSIPNIFKGEILWDQIRKIESVKYNGFVYDFCVPGVENFAAGLGGIITHNSSAFAGIQATFLNIKGGKNLVEAVKKCWASLFEPRSIYYRQTKGFDHLKVGIAVPIQEMVQAEVAGVLFTVDPVTNDKNTIDIEAGYGLGEVVVSGSINPDRYLVSKKDWQIKKKNIARQTWTIKKIKEENKRVLIEREDQEKQKLGDKEIVELAKIGQKIEDHYKFPQDIEWAYDNKKIYIVQTRPVTTTKKKKGGSGIMSSEHRVLLKRTAASIGESSGKVKIVKSPKKLDKIKKGDVLATKMTNPSYVPAMKRATAIITDQGGVTSHASITSRELGIPCVVGTGVATEQLKDGQVVTVSGAQGLVYEGAVARKEAKPFEEIKDLPETKIKIYVNLSEPEAAERIAKLPVDGVGLLRAEFMIAGIGYHPRWFIEKKKEKEFIEELSKGMEKFTSVFDPRPVIYRATDLKTNEYANLKGGKKYERSEANPMIGFRGAMRYLADPEVFKLELKAISKVREKYQSLHLMIPFVRTIDEMKKIKGIIKRELKEDDRFKLYLMCEVPSTVILAQEFIDLGIQGFSIGSNDLTQLILGLDRDNERVAFEFDERNEAVLWALKRVIKICKKNKKDCSICGQAPSIYPDITKFLVKNGITSISVNPDVIAKTKKLVAKMEKG